MKKVDVTNYPVRTLWSFTKLNEDLKRAFVECDEWEDFYNKLKFYFIASDEQIEYVKKEFTDRRKNP